MKVQFTGVLYAHDRSESDYLNMWTENEIIKSSGYTRLFPFSDHGPEDSRIDRTEPGWLTLDSFCPNMESKLKKHPFHFNLGFTFHSDKRNYRKDK